MRWAQAIALIRRREWALLSVLAAAAFVYALARPFAQIHVEAKALCVLAPIAMLDHACAGCSRRARAPGRLLRQAAGAVFCALALVSTFLALRAAPVGFDDRGAEDLRALAEQIDGGSVVFLGVDRFAGYWLRGTLAESPGGYVPQDVDARPEKTWQQGLAMDFDTLSPSKLDHYDFAITTSAAYASTPPPSFEEVAREGDYVLWERTGDTISRRVLEEGGEPGKILDCAATEPGRGGATVLAEPVTIDQGDWEPTAFASAPATLTGIRRCSGRRHSERLAPVPQPGAADSLGGRRGDRRAAPFARGLLSHWRRTRCVLARGRVRDRVAARSRSRSRPRSRAGFRMRSGSSARSGSAHLP